MLLDLLNDNYVLGLRDKNMNETDITLLLCVVYI